MNVATRAPPSTISLVMPFSASACSTAEQIQPWRRSCGRDAHHLRTGRTELHRGRRVGKIRCHHPQRRLARRMNQAAELPGMRNARSSTTRTGERASMPGSRQVEQRIVRQHGADPDQDGVALRAQQMHPPPRGLSRDRDRFAAGGADLVVGRYRELQDHMRALVSDAAKMPGMIARRFVQRTGRYRLICRRHAVLHGPARPLPDWGPRSPTRRAQCLQQSRHPRRAAS